ncbi:MAG: hypothetical protein AAF515_22400 [Pseudomonadota bacterium]
MKPIKNQTLPEPTLSVAERVISEALARNIDGLRLCRELPADGCVAAQLTCLGQQDRLAQITRDLGGYWRVVHPLLERRAYGDARVRVETLRSALAIDTALHAYLAKLQLERTPKKRLLRSLQRALAVPRETDTPTLRELEHAFNADSHAWVRMDPERMELRDLEKGMLRTYRRSRSWGVRALKGEARDARAVARWRDWLGSSEVQLALLADRYDAELRSLHGRIRRLSIVVQDLYCQVALEALAARAEEVPAQGLLAKARKPLVKRARALSQRAYGVDKAGARSLIRRALETPLEN